MARTRVALFIVDWLEKGAAIACELRLGANQMTNSHSQPLHVAVHQMNKVLSFLSSTFSLIATLAVVVTVGVAIADGVGWRFQKVDDITNVQFPAPIVQSQFSPENSDRS